MTRKLDSTGRIILSPTGHRTCCCATKPCLDDEPGVYYVGLLPCGGGVYSGCDDIGTTSVPCIIVDKRLLDTPGANVYNIYGICYTATFGATTDKSKCEVVEWTDTIPCVPIVFRYTVGAPTFPVVGGGCAAVECTPANAAWIATGCDGEELPLVEGSRQVFCIDGSCGNCYFLAYPTAIQGTDIVTDLRGASLDAFNCCGGNLASTPPLQSCAPGAFEPIRCDGCYDATSGDYVNCCGRTEDATSDGFSGVSLLDCTTSYSMSWDDFTDFGDGTWTRVQATASYSGSCAFQAPGLEVTVVYTDSGGASITTYEYNQIQCACGTTSGDVTGVGGQQLDTYGGFIVGHAIDGHGTQTHDCYGYSASCVKETISGDTVRTETGTVSSGMTCNPQSPCVRTCSASGVAYIGDYL